MQLSSISFGKKIPVVKGKVKQLETGRFVNVKLYEYDCMDAEDIIEVKNLPCNKWSFCLPISNGMVEKKYAREKFSIDTGYSYYTLQDDNKNTVGIVAVKDSDDYLGVKFIETDRGSKYKYSGQALLASLALMALRDKKNIFEIRFPTDEAIPFYVDKCGFKQENNSMHLSMNPKDMKKFVKRTQKRIHSPLIDIRG
ncbi:MAG: hypothetical protein E7Z90_05775 [Cyanobacteria bacterium SIG29]|nr:hypothetical protein [Cyanobacteria bacterium SIG29]